jgi:hypothetical protein
VRDASELEPARSFELQALSFGRGEACGQKQRDQESDRHQISSSSCAGIRLAIETKSPGNRMIRLDVKNFLRISRRDESL